MHLTRETSRALPSTSTKASTKPQQTKLCEGREGNVEGAPSQRRRDDQRFLSGDFAKIVLSEKSHAELTRRFLV